MANKRSLPTPRGEGMSNIVAATIRLLEQKSPQEITLRDVAKESGHGHRLIVEWFGGTGGLYAAVFNEFFSSLTTTGELFAADIALRRDVRTAFHLFNYMRIHHPDFVDSARTNFVLESMKERLMTNLGVTESKAHVIATRMALLNIGIAIFQDFFEWSEDDIVQMVQDEFRSTTGLTLPRSRPSEKDQSPS